jgi:hypothetical protein
MDQVTLPMGVDAMAMSADAKGRDRPTVLMKAIALLLSANALAMNWGFWVMRSPAFTPHTIKFVLKNGMNECRKLPRFCS